MLIAYSTDVHAMELEAAPGTASVEDLLLRPQPQNPSLPNRIKDKVAL